MKKVLKVLMFICLIIYGTSAYAELSDQTYTDDVSGTTFKIPAGWTEETSDNEKIAVKFRYNADETVAVSYGSEDLWSKVSTDEQDMQELNNYSRVDYNNDILTANDFNEVFYEIGKSLGTTPKDIKTQEYNGYEYYTALFDCMYNYDGIEIPVQVTQFYSVVNGYMNFFQFVGSVDNPAYADFIGMLGSADLGPVPAVSEVLDDIMRDYAQKNAVSSIIKIILSSFVITVLIYSIPIIIYRFFIHGKPIEPKKARKITIIYALIAYSVMFIIVVGLMQGTMSGTAIFLWSFINYYILSHGYTNSQEYEEYVFLHTCSVCGHTFKMKYNKPNTKENVPVLSATCPKCKSKEIFKYKE